MTTEEKIVGLIAARGPLKLSMRELASEVGVSHTACWRALRRLETEGVVCRDRKNEIVLTGRG